MKRLHEVNLFGVVKGEIWQGCQCTKEFRKTFTFIGNKFNRPWPGLESALDSIINDGDFEYCQIEEIWGDAVWFDGRDFIHRPLRLEPTGKLLSQYLCPDHLL